MTQNFDHYIEMLLAELPPICTDRDLVRVGVFPSLSTVTMLRGKGGFIPHLQLGGRYKYLRGDVIDWLKLCYFDTMPKVEKRGAKRRYRRIIGPR